MNTSEQYAETDLKKILLLEYAKLRMKVQLRLKNNTSVKTFTTKQNAIRKVLIDISLQIEEQIKGVKKINSVIIVH